MSPIPPDDPVSVPVWVMQALVIPIALGLLWALYRLGLREMSRWQQQIEEMQEQQKQIREQVRDVRRAMHSDHGDVEDHVRRLDDKLDQVLEEV